MEMSIRELRFFDAVIRAGTFTDAALDLGVSQAAVSRTIAGLERRVGGRLLRRTPHGAEPSARGLELLPQIRRVLAEADALGEAVTSHRGVLRLGYAWAAVGVHTTPLLRQWAEMHPDVELRLVKYNSPTAGLEEGVCDASIVRAEVDPLRIESVAVGQERRLVVFGADDAEWGRRRTLSMDEVAARPILVNPRSGTTHPDLWPPDRRPDPVVEVGDTDGWLDAISGGRGVGITSEATATYSRRAGIAFRRISDAPLITVRLAWYRQDRPVLVEALADLLTGLYASTS